MQSQNVKWYGEQATITGSPVEGYGDNRGQRSYTMQEIYQELLEVANLSVAEYSDFVTADKLKIAAELFKSVFGGD